MVSWLDVSSDLTVYASCDLRYLEVSCEILFAFLFLILNISLFYSTVLLTPLATEAFNLKNSSQYSESIFKEV